MNRLLFLLLALVWPALASAQTSNWQAKGPVDFPLNISGQINGIGRVCEIRFAPNNPNSVFACSASGGLWKSTDAGEHWFALGTDQLPQMNTASVCIDFTDSNTIYLASGDPNYYSTDLGIWKTTDGGQNWVQVNTGIGTRMAVELLMDPANHLVLIAATNSGIWKTTDGGQTWTEKLTGNSFTDMQWQPAAAAPVLYASSMNKFFRSTDKGDTWTEITTGFNNLLASGTRIAVSAANPSLVYVGTVNDEGTIFRSLDSGQSFTIQYHNPSWSLTGYDSTGGGQGNYNFCIEASPVNPDQLFLGSHNVMRSDDGGVTWQKLTKWWQTVHTDMHDWAFQPGNPTRLFQSNDGGVWLTENAGVNWVQKSDGLGATENYQAAVSPLQEGLISTGTQDNGELVFTDGQWKTNRGGDWTTRMIMDYSTLKHVYYFDDKERRQLPSGGGNAYEAPAVISPTTMKHVFSPDNAQLGYVSGNQIWRTQNLEAHQPVWTQIVGGNAVIRSMGVCAGHPNLFAYSASNRFYISHNALNAAPVFADFAFPVTGSAVDIAWSGQDTNLIYILIGSKVFRTADGGVSWTDMSGSLPVINHLRIFLDDYSGNEGVYVGNTQGVFYRNATMPDWVNYSGALPTIAPIRNFLCYNDGGTDARLYVSYFGRGVWETDLENPHTCAAPQIVGSQWNGNAFQVSWSGTASNYAVQYRELGTMAWTTQTVSATNFSVSNYAGCASYELRVKALCAGDTSLWSNRVLFQTPSQPLNNDFDGHQDIGPVGAAGSVCYDAPNARYTIYASGEDIWDQSDEFHFLHRKWVGDVMISARVKHIGNIYGWAKGGVMVRETLDPDARHAMCVLTPGNGFAMQWREQTGGGSSNKDTAGSAPGWVKMERQGNVFNAYFSFDGQNWELLQTATINMNDTVYIGLANCSHIDTAINDAVFDQIVINGKGLGVEEAVQGKSPFRTYPNPARETLSVQCAEEWLSGHYTARILDVAGKPVHSLTLNLGPGTTSSLDVSSLSSGTYVLLIEGKSRYAVRFVKD